MNTTQIINKTIKEGDKAPDFSLKNEAGEMVSLKALQGQTVILYFYPKDLTPGCTIEACNFRDSMPQLKQKNIVVLGVSRDSESLHQKFIDKHNLNFPLLVDHDGKVCKKYGVLKIKTLFGRQSQSIARSTFVINPQGIIQKAYHNIKAQGHVEQILKEIVAICF